MYNDPNTDDLGQLLEAFNPRLEADLQGILHPVTGSDAIDRLMAASKPQRRQRTTAPRVIPGRSKSITIRIPSDLLAAILTESDRSGMPYQTLINATLRDKTLEWHGAANN